MAHDEQHAAILVEVLLEHLMRDVISMLSEMQSAWTQRSSLSTVMRDVISMHSGM